MVTKEQMERINELYKKKTETGLTEQEEKEQAELRRIYIDSFKQNLKSQLENIEFVDVENTNSDGNNNSNDNAHKHNHGKGCGCGCESQKHKHTHTHKHLKH